MEYSIDNINRLIDDYNFSYKSSEWFSLGANQKKFCDYVWQELRKHKFGLFKNYNNELDSCWVYNHATKKYITTIGVLNINNTKDVQDRAYIYEILRFLFWQAAHCIDTQKAQSVSKDLSDLIATINNKNYYEFIEGI